MDSDQLLAQMVKLRDKMPADQQADMDRMVGMVKSMQADEDEHERAEHKDDMESAKPADQLPAKPSLISVGSNDTVRVDSPPTKKPVAVESAVVVEQAAVAEETVMKIDGGNSYPATAYAYVPDPSKPSEWKLRLWEDPQQKVTRAQLGRAAAAFSPGGFRGEQVQIPVADQAAVKAKIHSAYTTLGVAADDIPQWLKESADQLPIAESAGDSISFSESGRITSSESGTGKVWNVEVIKSGPNLSGTRVYTPESLREATPLVENLQCFLDHPTQTAEANQPERSVTELVGWFTQPQFNEATQAITAKLNLLTTGPAKAVLDMIREAFSRGNPNLVGLSIRGSGAQKPVTSNGKPMQEVQKITRLLSADIVTMPAAGGRLVSIAESVRNVSQEESMPDKNVEVAVKEADKQVAESVAVAVDTKALQEAVGSLSARLDAQAQEAEIEKQLSASTLPDKVKAKVRRQFTGHTFDQVALAESIKEEQAIYDELKAQLGVPAGARQFAPPAGAMTTAAGRENFEKSIDVMLSGKSVPGVRPFRSLKEAYSVWKSSNGGGYVDVLDGYLPYSILRECAGYYDPTMGALRESVSSSTFSTILGDSIHRIMIGLYRDLEMYNDWRKMVSQLIPVTDFKTYKFSRLGGYAQPLPSVGEGGTYQPLTSPGEDAPSFSVSKYGGLETLTLEAIANDDLGALRQIPRRMALVAKETLYKYVFDLITTNPTLGYDSVALFASGHANIGSTAFSYAQVRTAMVDMLNQRMKNTGPKLGIKPKTLLVPPALWDAADRTVNSSYLPGQAPGATSVTPSSGGGSPWEPNPIKGQLEVITMLHTTDANDWFLVADPAQYDTIGLGFFGGKEEPELFTQEDPKVGSAFTADSITYKIRHIYGGVVLDHRSFWGAIVS